MWPRMWCTGMSGMPSAAAALLAKFTPTSTAPMSPGAYDTATASSSDFFTPAAAIARSASREMTSTWLREAISGTTPPYTACRSACEKIWSVSTFRPFSVTATAVSSHVDSTDNISIALLRLFLEEFRHQNSIFRRFFIVVFSFSHDFKAVFFIKPPRGEIALAHLEL